MTVFLTLSFGLILWCKQMIESWRDAFREVGDPECRKNPGKNVHGVMRAQDQDRGHLKEDEQHSGGCEPISVQAGYLNRPENRDGGMPGEEKIVGDVIGHQ